jgi:hypothetical protein
MSDFQRQVAARTTDARVLAALNALAELVARRLLEKSPVETQRAALAGGPKQRQRKLRNASLPRS